MSNEDRSRQPAGVPTGGQFATEVRGEVDVDLGGTTATSGDAASCSECGKPTKRRSGLCRQHDPSRKTKGEATTRPSVVAGVGVVTTSKGAMYDTDQEPVDEAEIVQCDYKFVPVYRNGQKSETGEVRPCKNAVRSPGVTCHQHGGAKETSLGRTIAKAQAEARRGECFPLADEHWDQEDERLAHMEGQLLEMLDTDTTALAQAFLQFRRGESEYGVGRFSDMNQLLVLASHAYNVRHDNPDMDSADVWNEAATKSREPHMTKDAWERHGREVTDPDNSVPTVWFQPGVYDKPDREPGEAEGDYNKRVKEEGRFIRGKHGGHIQFPLSATDGEPFEVHDDVIDTYRPSGFGDASAARATMTKLATDMGIEVEFAKERPSVAAAYWHAAQNKIVVWEGLGGGDERAVVHALAHELGHARLGHMTDAQAEDRTPDKEVAAESFAALACAHHGVDTSDMSAWYVDGWRQAAGVNMKAGGLSPLRSAVQAFDEYVTATDDRWS